MSAIKKTTSKTSKSPAPATKETKTAAKPAAKKTVAKAASKPEAAAAAIVAAVARVAAPVLAEKAAAAAVKGAPSVVVTTIRARIDVGFGNALYVRGEGPGLSWDAGVAMENVGADLWQLQLKESARPIAFKFLVNDLTWSTGPDFALASGGSETFTPEF